MLQSAPRRNSSLMNAASDHQHRRKLFLAMLILFATLIVVLVRDGQLWFYNGEEAPRPEDTAWVGPSESSASTAVQAAAAPAATVAKHVTGKATPEKAVAEPPIIATNRTALPPLNVEVVSGDGYHTVHLSNNAAMPRGTSSAAVASATAAPGQLTNVAQRTVTPQTEAPVIEQTVVAEYPVLARQMKVQGSVLMQALIGANGVIEDLRVISGPAILAAAARQAVMQYHFKPYLQNGQPVETSARVTVNFAIKVLGDVTARLGGSSSNGSF